MALNNGRWGWAEAIVFAIIVALFVILGLWIVDKF